MCENFVVMIIKYWIYVGFFFWQEMPIATIWLHNNNMYKAMLLPISNRFLNWYNFQFIHSLQAILRFSETLSLRFRWLHLLYERNMAEFCMQSSMLRVNKQTKITNQSISIYVWNNLWCELWNVPLSPAICFEPNVFRFFKLNYNKETCLFPFFFWHRFIQMVSRAEQHFQILLGL